MIQPSARQRILQGLRYEHSDLADDAAEADAFIQGPGYDALPRARQVQWLRRHANLVWHLQDIADQIAALEGPAASTAPLQRSTTSTR